MVGKPKKDPSCMLYGKKDPPCKKWKTLNQSGIGIININNGSSSR